MISSHWIVKETTQNHAQSLYLSFCLFFCQYSELLFCLFSQALCFNHLTCYVNFKHNNETNSAHWTDEGLTECQIGLHAQFFTPLKMKFIHLLMKDKHFSAPCLVTASVVCFLWIASDTCNWRFTNRIFSGRTCLSLNCGISSYYRWEYTVSSHGLKQIILHYITCPKWTECYQCVFE